ncbi:MAG TPA: HAMP domain-containing sensor histidine kinase [Alphaproteobacteria bacterium]|nr:HAMP domain-containing sensor histidine kinase [Alphaproteobacteria bacterium]
MPIAVNGDYHPPAKPPANVAKDILSIGIAIGIPLADSALMNREEELAELVKELKTAVRARDAFLAVAAHELRNPMHALLLQIGNSLNAARKLGDDDLIQRLERVKFVIDRYVKRATTLLDVSRINAGGFNLQLEDMDFVDVVREVASSYEIEATFTGATLNVTVPDRLDGRWDELAVEQIVANLISNAIKYGAEGSVDVTLAREGESARLTVRDHGIGISAEDQSRIFEPFEQVVTREMRGGFGIGLWLVRWLVEAHGGTISVKSAPHEGAIFTVRLPLDSTSSERIGNDER